MNEAIERLADLLRGGIVIEKDGENAVRIRLEDRPAPAEKAAGSEETERISW